MSTQISRPTTAAAALVWKHPEAIPPDGIVTVGQNEECVLMRDGALFKIFGPGSHHIHAPSYAEVEAYFVSLSGQVKFGTTARVKDGASGADVQLRCFGEASLRITDTARVVIAVGGDGLDRYVGQQVGKAVSTEAARLAMTGVMAFVSDPGQIHQAVAAAQGALASRDIVDGVQLAGFGNVNITLPAEDMQKLGGAGAAAPQRVAQQQAQQQQTAPAPQAGRYPDGTRVWAYWTDGNWYPAVIKQHGNGQYLVDWEGNPDTAWVPETHVKPVG